MSCQQASRYIATNNNSTIAAAVNKHHQQLNSTTTNINNNTINTNSNLARILAAEDPYVFTESVPTTPPILFNTQSRSRLSEIIGGTTISLANVQHQQQITTTQTNGKLAAIKTQASYDKKSSLSNSTTGATATSSLSSSLKNVTTQSLANCKTSSTHNNKKITNVCIVRPQLQQQQQQPQHVIHSSCTGLEEDLKSISPPPLYTPPTPSLWQTPLLIEAASPPAVPNPPPPTAATPAPLQQNSVTSSSGGGNVVGLSTNATTVMAKVAPIVVQTTPSSGSLASCLPPSKFHNHTLAQHLQKLECLKKPKKSVQPMAATTPMVAPPSLPFIEDLLKNKSCLSSVEPRMVVDNDDLKSDKHSDSEELNEIPVNVIFRMALVPQQEQQQQNDNQSKKQNKTTPANNRLTSSLSTTTTPHPQNIKVNRNRLATASNTTPASRYHYTQQQQQQQINTSSKQQSLEQQAIKLPTQDNVMGNNNDGQNIENSAPTCGPPPPTTLSKSKFSNTKSLNTTRKSCNAHSLQSFDTYPSGCSTNSKGAVAIVRLSHHPNEDPASMDISHLATATGLPYCLQHYWFNSYEFRKSSSAMKAAGGKKLRRSALREERIACYRQQLHRQALQFLSTRSLQKLPLKAARRRLICVDRLLRKYYKQNEQGLSANVKRCTFTGCDANALEMATHCQKHIVLSAGKELFLPCTAKFADNTQCRVPVFDITHDLPLCLEHARKRDAYNRLLYEHRPRKQSAAAASAPTPASILMQDGTHKNTFSLGKQTYKQQQQRPSTTVVSIGSQQQTPMRKRKQTGNPVGRPQKRPKKIPESSSTTASCSASNAPLSINLMQTTTATSSSTTNQMPRLSSTVLRRKGSITSLESIASNSQHSTTSNTSHTTPQATQQQFYSMTSNSFSNQQPAAAATATTVVNTLPPPALAPLSTGGFMVNNSFPQHLFSFGHDTNNSSNATTAPNAHTNKHSSSVSNNTNNPPSIISPTTEFKDFISNLPSFTVTQQKTATATNSALESIDPMTINTNSNSNFTSSGMGSTTSLTTAADDFLTQDMLSICENSSASSVDTGLGGLSDRELMLVGPDGDDIPLGDTHLLEENDLANVLNSLPEDAFKELFATVHQDESDEIERAIELADKHLKTLQQTISSELGDFLDFSDDMLMDNGDICNAEGVAVPNGILDTASLFVGTNTAVPGGLVNVGGGSSMVLGGNGTTTSVNDIRGLVQT
ncbi:zf-C3Hc3H domain-containing lethal (3) L1231 isoform X2 [Musca autumnalis]|uniref:zf-C3Hc3H domain-containing lethal (3) L1231 isoform X2 n=1 Tax=Musca autumnalis TaxID=221902 RepID=UPI003CE8E9EC